MGRYTLKPIFSTLQNDYHIVHLYVHRPDGTVIVRIHRPEKYGDDITYRRTAAAALKTKTTVPGIEIGPSRLGIRSVSPLFEQNEFIGMVEVGLDYDQPFVEYLKAEHGVDYRMWVTTEAAAPAVDLDPFARDVVNPGQYEHDREADDRCDDDQLFLCKRPGPGRIGGADVRVRRSHHWHPGNLPASDSGYGSRLADSDGHFGHRRPAGYVRVDIDCGGDCHCCTEAGKASDCCSAPPIRWGVIRPGGKSA